MPEMCFPIRTTGLRSLPALILVLIGAALGGCSGGDLGRTRQDFRNDDMHRWLGAEATGSVGLRASQFQLTENERQLRDLAFPLIEPPRSRPAWKSVFGDYQPLPSPWRSSAICSCVVSTTHRRSRCLPVPELLRWAWSLGSS